MTRLILKLCILFCFCPNMTGQPSELKLRYAQDDVSVILDGKHQKVCPSKIKLDFNLNRELVFYKQGYYSKHIIIDADSSFSDLHVKLKQKDTQVKLESKKLILPDTLILLKTVTNFTTRELKEALNSNFLKNNFVIGHEFNLFEMENNSVENARYKIAAEILDSKQYRAVYKSPKFVMANISIRWTLLDVKQNKVVYHKTKKGLHCAMVQKTKGLVINDLMTHAIHKAIEENQEKLFIDPDFRKLFTDNEG